MGVVKGLIKSLIQGGIGALVGAAFASAFEWNIWIFAVIGYILGEMVYECDCVGNFNSLS